VFWVLFPSVVGRTLCISFLLPSFFLVTTSVLKKFVLRCLAHGAVVYFTIDVSYLITRLLHKYCEVPGSTRTDGDISNTGFIFFGFMYAHYSVFGRTMQAGNLSVEEALLYELSGAILELSMADTLLRGSTPTQDCVDFAKFLFSPFLRGRGQATNKVYHGEEDSESVADVPQMQPVTAEPATAQEDVPSPPPNSLVRSELDVRCDFCADVLIVMSLAEGCSIIVVAAFVALVPISFGEPGTPPISLHVCLRNAVIMIVGELFVTDGIISVVSAKLGHRRGYIVDIALSWKSRRKHYGWYCVILVFFPLVAFNFVLKSLCYTSHFHSEDDYIEGFALTSCPAQPTDASNMMNPTYIPTRN
jgi:hypothetical protein